MTIETAQPCIGILHEGAGAVIDRHDTVACLHSGLKQAASTLAAADARAAVVARSEQAAGIFAAAAVACATAGGAERLMWVSRGAVVCTTCLPLLAIGAGLAAWIVAVARSRAIPLSRAAERLDLAAADQNAIATALDLASGLDAGAFVSRAILQGQSALRVFAGTPPAVNVTHVRYGRVLLMPLMAGLVCLVVALLLPMRKMNPASSSLDAPSRVNIVSTSFQTNRDDVRSRESRPESSRVRTATDVAHAGTTLPKGTPPTKASQIAGASAATATTGGDGTADASRRMGDTSHSPRSGENPSASNDSRPDDARQPADDPTSSQHVGAFGSETPAGATSAAGHASGATAETSDGDGSKNGKPDTASSAQKGGSGAAQNKKKAGKGDAASTPGDALGKGKHAGTGHAVGIPDLNAAGGTGQGSGQNAPKKARGVPPLLLGTPMPDQIEGQPGLGPDTRSKSQTPPAPMPGEPSPSSQALARQGPEPVVPTFRVPGEQRNTVEDYFKQLHELDAASQAVR